LSGPIPHTVGQLSVLQKWFLSSNKLNGVTNETHLSNLSLLISFDVSQTSLSFNLSSIWFPPFKLERLHASPCTLWVLNFQYGGGWVGACVCARACVRVRAWAQIVWAS